MSKKVLFFPGQASQYVGMGQDLYKASDEVKELYKFASSEMNFDIAKLSFEGPQDELKRTKFTQPAILLHSLAVLTILKNNITNFDYACGHSLGEFSALVAVSAMSFEDAIKAVVNRAVFMEEACQEHKSSMAAIIGLNEKQIQEVCDKASSKGVVVPANFNSKSQIAISGSIDAIAEAVKIAKEAGAKRALILEVGGAFHSPLMKSAKEKLNKYLSSITINNPLKPIIANVTASQVTTGDEIRKLLVEQITAPVKWAQSMKCLVDCDVKEVYEIGPGKVLSGLAKREMRPEKITSLSTISDIESFSGVSI